MVFGSNLRRKRTAAEDVVATSANGRDDFV